MSIEGPAQVLVVEIPPHNGRTLWYDIAFIGYLPSIEIGNYQS